MNRPVRLYSSLPRVLKEPAKCVQETHLLDRATPSLEEPRARHKDRKTPRPRDRDVEPIPLEQEFHIARRVRTTRSRHREEHDRRLAALELVDGADLNGTGERIAQASHLLVVGGDHHEVALMK